MTACHHGFPLKQLNISVASVQRFIRSSRGKRKYGRLRIRSHHGWEDSYSYKWMWNTHIQESIWTLSVLRWLSSACFGTVKTRTLHNSNVEMFVFQTAENFHIICKVLPIYTSHEHSCILCRLAIAYTNLFPSYYLNASMHIHSITLQIVLLL